MQNLVTKSCVVKYGKYSLAKFANFVYAHIAEIVTIFEPKMVTISARNTYTKFANFARLYFPSFTAFSNQILQFY
jgi:hypothetical protein